MSDTISLYDGLEALYYFGTDYFDGTAISDRSGYGRHATASGGITFSDTGYRGFGSATEDGTDDQLDISDPLAADAQTVVVLFKPTNLNGSEQVLIDTDDGTNGYALLINSNDNLEWGVRDGSGTLQTVTASLSQDEYVFGVGLFSGATLRLATDTSLAGTQSVSGHNQADDNARIAADISGASHFAGEIGLLARWSRELTDAEWEETTRLTAPLRGVSP